MSTRARKGTRKRQATSNSDDVDKKKSRKTEKSSSTTSKYFKNSTEAPSSEQDESNTQAKTSKKLAEEFFQKSCIDLAKALLGKKFVRKLEDGNVVEANIVETEAYLGGDDKAAHSYNGKRTERNEAMYMKPGTIYVYHIYGMYTCINISSQGNTEYCFLSSIEFEGTVDQ